MASSTPPVNEMVKIGLWLELDIGIGFLVGLGFGSLIGQRTIHGLLMIVLEIIVTPLLAPRSSPTSSTASGSSSASRWTSCARPRGRRVSGGGGGGPGPGHFCSAGAEPSAYRRCRPGR